MLISFYGLFTSQRLHTRSSPEFRCTVAKYAIAHGGRPTATKYKLPESTVRGFVKSFKSTQKENPNTDLEVVPKRKRGRPTLLPEEIDQKVMIITKKVRQSGAVINYSIITAVATGIIITNDRTLLKENGGTITLEIKWCESISKRLGYVKTKATAAKPLIAPGLIKEIVLTFYNDINKIVHAHAIPAEIIINIDQTSLPFVLISKYTLEKKGSSHVSVPGTSDYCQIKGTFSISMAGSFLPIQLIYQGQTKLCQTKYNFPNEFHVTQTPNHWADENTSIK